MIRPDPETSRRLGWSAVTLYLCGLGIAAVLRTQADFNTYYRAGIVAAQGGNFYDPKYNIGFLYAPIFAIGFVPFGMLPLKAAQAAWFAVNAAALVALIFGAGRLLFGRRRRLPAALIVLPVLFSARFIDNNIEHGQIDLITFALLTWGIALAEEERPRPGGAMLAAAIMIKPFATLGALYLILRRRLDALGWMIAAGVVLLILPMLFFGPRSFDVTVSYLHAVAAMTGRFRTMLTNQSATSAVARLLEAPGGANRGAERVSVMLGIGLEAALVAAVSWWVVASRGDGAGAPAGCAKTPSRRDPSPMAEAPCTFFGGLLSRLALCGLFCIMPSLAPVSWKHYYVALLIPYMALLSGMWIDKPAQRQAPIAAWALMILSIVLNLETGHRLMHLALFYSVHFVSSLMVLAALFAVWRSQKTDGVSSRVWRET
ncbi:MAG: glycosyltransferase family 87 protein [Candidatus Binataceae bacterium]